MKISNNSQNNKIFGVKPFNGLTFGSKNCPIKPFSIQTSKGPLSVMEMPQSDFIKTINFYFDCYVDSINAWKPLKNCSKSDRNHQIGYIGRLLKRSERRPDGNSTILIAKDSSDNIKAVFDMQSFDESLISRRKKFSDLKTGYISDCIVDAEFRSQGVGAKMLEKLLTTADGYFTDVILTAENPAVGFYKRSGFEPFDTSNTLIDKFNYVFLKDRKDRDKLTVMSKSLNPDEPWWKRLIPLAK